MQTLPVVKLLVADKLRRNSIYCVIKIALMFKQSCDSVQLHIKLFESHFYDT